MHEKPIPLKDVAELFGVTPATVLSWTQKRNRHGKVLYAFKMGSRWYTTESAIEDYKEFPKSIPKQPDPSAERLRKEQMAALMRFK